MRFLLVAADKSSKIPVKVPDEIVADNKTSKKEITSKKRAKRPSISKSKKSRKPRNTSKRRQIAKAIAK